jgi:hypothetical protein
MIGMSVGHYQITARLGAGGMGEVFLARDARLARQAAIKFLPRELAVDPERRQRFLREARAASALSHPHVCVVYDVGETEDGLPYIAMEYVQGQSLDALIAQGPLEIPRVVEIAIQVVDALDAAHSNHIVHRDIKPANIIFVGGQPKIADIGLVASTGQLSYVGTEGYVPPEGPGTAQADIYSLGKVIYEIAMGKDRLDFPAVNSNLATLPDKERLLRLNEVLLRACANDPAARYASADELHDDLARLREGRPLARRGTRRWPWAVALGAAACAIGVFAFFSRTGAQGGVLIETEPHNAMVILDGTMKHTPARFDGVRAGAHSAHIKLGGYDPVDLPIEVVANADAHPAKITLSRSHGSARIESKPAGASFELREGERIIERGAAPGKIARIPTGKYTVVLRFDGREVSEPIEIERDAEALKQVEFAAGRIAITSTPPGADVFVGERKRGTAPIEIELPEGTHEIVAKYRGWPELRREV